MNDPLMSKAIERNAKRPFPAEPVKSSLAYKYNYIFETNPNTTIIPYSQYKKGMKMFSRIKFNPSKLAKRIK